MLPEILKVSVEGGESVFVPLTPVTTFKDVSACVREPGDPLPLILEESPLGARVVPGWERPLELLRLWGDFKEQVKYNASFSLSRHLKDELYLKEDSPLRARSRTPDPTSMKFGNIDPWELYELRDDLKDLLLHDLSFLNESSSLSESNDAWELRDSNTPAKYDQHPFGGESSSDNDHNLNNSDVFNMGFVSKTPYPNIKSIPVRGQTNSPNSRHSSILESNKENEGSPRDTDESHLQWTSFNSHTKDKRYRKRIRKSHMTEEEQNNHLQSLLQESRLASIYGSPFRRGSIQTCSFPSSSAKQYDLKRLNGKNHDHRRLYGDSVSIANDKNENEKDYLLISPENKNSLNNNNIILKESPNQGNNLQTHKVSSAINLTNVPFKRIPKNPCRSPDCHSGNLTSYQSNRKSFNSDSMPPSQQHCINQTKSSSREFLQTEYEINQHDGNLTSRDVRASLPPYVISPHYLSQLHDPVASNSVTYSPTSSKVQPNGGQQFHLNAPSHSSSRSPVSNKDPSIPPQLPFNQNQFGNPNTISNKVSTTSEPSLPQIKEPAKKELSQSEQTTSSSFRFFNKFPNKYKKEGEKNPPKHETSASESHISLKPSHNLESSTHKLQKPLSPKLKIKTMSPKQLKRGKNKVDEQTMDAKFQKRDADSSNKTLLNNNVVHKTQNKFFFQNKTNHGNKNEPSSRKDKQELISNKPLSTNNEQRDKRPTNLIRKSILRNTLFSSGASSSSTTSSSLSTLGSEPKSCKKHLGSFNEKLNSQPRITSVSNETLKRHNSIPTICKTNLKSSPRVASSSSDLLDSSSDNEEDEISLSLSHRQQKLLSYKERVNLAPKSSLQMENLQNKTSAKILLFRKMVKDIPNESNMVPNRNNDRLMMANNRLSQRRSRSKHRNMECDHRRSYSDPLYEYLEENRKMERRRRHSGGAIPASNEGMKDSQSQLQLIPDSGDLTVNELREMATRQQQHIESQQQLLVAREQRLKYLKQQEGRTSQMNMETERLRRLRERVEAQEAKLRRLRALRGQVDNSRLNAASLYSDLDAMRHLFSEKEKELVDAAAKVEELTRQLEDVRGGRGISSSGQNGNVTNTSQLQIHHQELEKLRRELLYRNSVNREASSRVSSQKEALTTRKEEIGRIDKRIAELTQRLHRKRVLNQQLTSQISAATQAKQAQLKAVQQKTIRDGKNDHSADGANIEDHRNLEDISQFDRGKHDPKYQTLPYNTKFSSGVKGGPGSGQRSNYENAGSENESNGSSSDSNPSHHQSASVVNNSNIRNNGLAVSATSTSSASVLTNNSASNGSNSNLGVITSTVHSTPAHLATKSHALAPCPTNQSGIPTYAPSSAPVTQNFMTRGQNSNAIGTTSSNQSSLSSSQMYHQKLLPESCQPIPVSSSLQKVIPSLIQQQQNRNNAVPSVHPTQNTTNKDVENVRALGYPAAAPPPMLTNTPPTIGYHSSNSISASHQSSSNNVTSKSYSSGVVTSASSSGELQEENSDQINGKLKPILPPKPVVPSKPTPPPRQKGDPMASSTESINLIGVSNHRSSASNRPQVFRYASQNVILSTYTQQQQLVNQQPITSMSRDAQSNKGTPLTNQSGQTNEKQSQDPSKSKAIISKESSEICDENSVASEKVHVSINRRIEMPPDFLFPEDAIPPSDLLGRQSDDLARTDRLEVRGRPSEKPEESKHTSAEDVHSVPSGADHKLRIDENSKEDSLENNSFDATDRINVSNHINANNNSNNINLSNIFNNCVNNLNVANNNMIGNVKDFERLRIEDGEKGDAENEFDKFSDEMDTEPQTAPSSNVVRRLKKGNLKTTNSSRIPRRVSFDPLALLLDASLEGELELVKRTATEVPNPSAANDEGITALHNAICAGHLDIVTFLVTFGCDVNAQDSDGWTPLHCAASCNNVAMVRFLVEHGACVLATTLSDHETAAEKCEQDEEGYDGCSQYLYSVQEKLGIMNGGVVYAVYEYDSQNDDELSFKCSDSLTVIRRGDEYERDWWWVRISDKCGYVPRNLLGLYPRVKNPLKTS